MMYWKITYKAKITNVRPVETNETSHIRHCPKVKLTHSNEKTSNKKQNGKRAKNLKWFEIRWFWAQCEKGKGVVNGSNRTFWRSCNLLDDRLFNPSIYIFRIITRKTKPLFKRWKNCDFCFSECKLNLGLWCRLETSILHTWWVAILRVFWLGESVRFFQSLHLLPCHNFSANLKVLVFLRQDKCRRHPLLQLFHLWQKGFLFLGMHHSLDWTGFPNIELCEVQPIVRKGIYVSSVLPSLTR